VLVSLLTVTAFDPHPIHADLAGGSTAYVNSSDGLNLRKGPAPSFDIITVMPGGSQVTITGSATGDNWLPITFNSQQGWADGAYLGQTPSSTPDSTSPPPAPPVATPTPAPVATAATVLSPDGLNLRSGPGTTFNVITVIPGGTAVTVTGPAKDTWLPVTASGQTGWVDGAYVSTDGSSPMITSNAVSVTAGAALPSSSATPGPAAQNRDGSTPPAGQYKLAWPTASRRISTVFSPSHLGVDIDEFPSGGNAVGASAAGTVTFAGGTACCSYGLYVIVDHGNGLATLYAHFSSISVQKGQAVTAGQKLGLSGCTGKCTGPHIHYEVRVDGKQVDPLRYLPPPWTIE
jgi:uncharacterized protein YraI